MIGDWLWDRNVSDAGARKILKDPGPRKFVTLAAILLSRKSGPREIFKHYLDPLIFCKHWNHIKQEMRKNRWNEPRIVYWQAVYEVLLERYRKKGVVFKKEIPQAKEPLCRMTGKKIREIRRERGIPQKTLAKKMNVSQQLISRIEKGRENISLATLANVAHALDKRVEINFCMEFQ